MCGIAGIVYCSPNTDDFNWSDLQGKFDQLQALVPQADHPPLDIVEALEHATAGLREYAPWATLWQDSNRCALLQRGSDLLEDFLTRTTALATAANPPLSTSLIETWNSLWVRVRDIAWTMKHDVLQSLETVRLIVPELYRNQPSQGAWKITTVLENIGRLEVRGRDSLGLCVQINYPDRASYGALVHHLTDEQKKALKQRLTNRELKSHTVRRDANTTKPSLLFTYKVATEIGALGDNVRNLRTQIAADELLWLALIQPGTEVSVWSHTRWASNGIISEANCHPVDELCENDPHESETTYWVAAAANGDVDNVRELAQQLQDKTGQTIVKTITCDTKIIPVMVNYHYRQEQDLLKAFCQTVSECEGSAAIVMQSSLDPDHIYLSLKGSGQSLFIGLCQNGYTFASELYGVVEQTASFVRMDGTQEMISGRPDTAGQIMVLTRGASGLEGLRSYHIDGSPLELTDKDIRHAEITTRDIDRGDHQHYLLKEINEAPQSVSKTLLGKIYPASDDSRQLRVNLGTEVFPTSLAERFSRGEIKRIRLIGQGTAAVAGSAIAAMMGRVLTKANIDVRAIKGTELSGYALDDNMHDMLVIAISQSGTTTDTNRTIDLVRSRQATVIGIVNRRNSDLVYKVDGVLYTSDGRDIEMSVASTKAFYSQVVAGYLISMHIADMLHTMDREEITHELQELQNLPQKMVTVLQGRQHVHELAKRYATTRSDWAVVGSGSTRAAADEIRIKLSELCYKSIATDYIEDKKHIDLSSEPLTIICAAGLPLMALRDAVKEVGIFKSHKSIPIVICTEGFDGFEGQAAGVIYVPAASVHASVLLNTIVGHLWGYYCAMTINESADDMRVGRALSVEHLASGGLTPTHQLLKQIMTISRHISEQMAQGMYNSSLSVSVAMRLAKLLPYFTETRSMRQFYNDFKGRNNLIETSVSVLSEAIQELSRPIDAIKHQAKTITVGISRSQEIVDGVLFAALSEVGVEPEDIPYRELSFIRALSMAVDRVSGSTLYDIKGLSAFNEVLETSTILAVKKCGFAASLRSRSDVESPILGTKQWVVNNRRVYVGHGRNDKRPILIVPVIKDGTVIRIALLHLVFVEEMTLENRLEMFKNLTNRYGDLKSQIEEANIIWKDEFLSMLSVEDLATERSAVLAERLSMKLGL